MSETFAVSPTERGVIRVFTVNLKADQIDGFKQTSDNGTGSALQTALGVNALDTNNVELFPLSNLEGVGLAGYLSDGLGVAPEDVKPYASRLNAMSGHILIIHSTAFGGTEATITPTAPLKWIGTYVEEGARINFEPLPSDGASGVITPAGKPPKSDARIGGMIAMYVLIAMFAFVGLLIWVGG